MTVSLRERNALATREAILGATVELMGSQALETITMPQVAEHAGVSLRTLYRYYGERDELEVAVGEWIAERLIHAPLPVREGDVADTIAEVGPRFEENVELVRALVRSRVGRDVRSGAREERLAAIAVALEDATAGLSATEQRRVVALAQLLCSAASWLELRDEGGLAGAEAGEALAWAIGLVLDEAHRRQVLQDDTDDEKERR